MMTRWISLLWTRLRRALARESDSGIDPELREVFVSELDEVGGALAALLPAWRQAREDPSILQEIRRGFHTLKGSGLAIGAGTLGAFCGRIEKHTLMLIEHPGRAAPDVIASIEAAIELLPDCARALRSHRPMPAAVRE